MVSPFRQQERQNRIYSNPIKAHNCLVLWCTLLPIHVAKSPHPLALPSFGYGDQHKMLLLQLLTAVSNKVLWLSRHMQITLWQGDLLTCKQSKSSDPSQFPTVAFLLKPSHCLPISNKEPHNDFTRLHMTWPPQAALLFLLLAHSTATTLVSLLMLEHKSQPLTSSVFICCSLCLKSSFTT